jgi:hypothetical protein
MSSTGIIDSKYCPNHPELVPAARFPNELSALSHVEPFAWVMDTGV